MSDPIGVAIVGTGFGLLAHVRAARAAGLEVRALVGRDTAKTTERAEIFSIPTGTTDLPALLTSDAVDVVAVATPPHAHMEIVHQALDAGKHVICEKPFALNLAEAKAMCTAAQQSGQIHLLGTEWRFSPSQAQLTRLVRAGVIGEPTLGVFQLHVPTHADPEADLPVWWQREDMGGGWLGTHATHTIDHVRTALGEIVGVTASLQRLVARPDMTADDTYTVMMRLDNDATVLLHASCAARGPFLSTMKIFGTGGTAWSEGDHIMTDDGSGPTAHPLPDDLPVIEAPPLPAGLELSAYDQWNALDIYHTPYTHLYRVLRARIEGGEPPSDPAAPTFADGVKSQAVLDAIRASSQAGGAFTPVSA